MLKENKRAQVGSITCGNQMRASPVTNPSNIKSSSLDMNIGLEQLISQLLRNILSNPENIVMLTEYFGNSEGAGDISPKTFPRVTSRGSQSRDISYNEIIRPRDLQQATGLSRTQCWRLSKDPTAGFPPKIRLSSGAIGFSKKLIEEWLASRQEICNE